MHDDDIRGGLALLAREAPTGGGDLGDVRDRGLTRLRTRRLVLVTATAALLVVGLGVGLATTLDDDASTIEAVSPGPDGERTGSDEAGTGAVQPDADADAAAVAADEAEDEEADEVAETANDATPGLPASGADNDSTRPSDDGDTDVESNALNETSDADDSAQTNAPAETTTSTTTSPSTTAEPDQGSTGGGNDNGDGGNDTDPPDFPTSLDAELTIEVRNYESGETITYGISCGDGTVTASGNPGAYGLDPTTMCDRLATADVRNRLIDGPPLYEACTMVWGGPYSASIGGTLDGASVTAGFSRNNGCGIGDWDRTMAGILIAANF
ncbi:MAG: hypothetical protein AAF467_22270 [Actinomycetota bacterium]